MFTKRVTHPDQAGAEAAGLKWLASANPAVVGVTEHSISTKLVN